MISLERVSKAYSLKDGQKRIIVDNLTMDFPHANIAILGRNGMGKSTLLRMLAGIEDPDEGQISRHLSVSWPIGFRGSFHGELTGLENVRFVARIYGQDTEYVIEYVKDFAELGEFFYAPVKTYSTGMGARLAFGLSMAVNFDCYLIDELLSVGDASFKEKSKRVFSEKLSNSKIIMVSHSMGDLREHCDCGIVVHDGNMTYYPDLDEAINLYNQHNKQ